MDKIIHQTVSLKCGLNRAFEMFTKNENLEKWLTVHAEIEPVAGGKYELFWKPEDRENDCTIGCKVLAIEENKFLCFEWKGPKQFKAFMNNRIPLTNVSVFFLPRKDSTEVQLLHTGWGGSDEWDKAREWFVEEWKKAFAKLKKYVNMTD